MVSTPVYQPFFNGHLQGNIVMEITLKIRGFIIIHYPQLEHMMVINQMPLSTLNISSPRELAIATLFH